MIDWAARCVLFGAACRPRTLSTRKRTSDAKLSAHTFRSARLPIQTPHRSRLPAKPASSSVDDPAPTRTHSRRQSSTRWAAGLRSARRRLGGGLEENANEISVQRRRRRAGGDSRSAFAWLLYG